ncbi:unnamed protein product [Paramecium primaurelia]|uniref:Anaphase-promoting complex subunit 5 n=1 Tax=Paramecium primaurelia TaxID=5886 RepID=A0A8S1NYW8_PARPR|nr:unnamed protein product [Paramecium primaurelia]
MNNNLILLILLLRKPSQQVYDLLTEYLKIHDVTEIINNPTLQNTILSHIEPELLQITSMNKFHKIIGETLREKQQQKTPGGSVVDLFFRNMLLLFNQMDFNQMLKSWSDFKEGQDNHLQNNPFLTDSYIEFLLTKLQTSSSYVNLEELKQIIEQPNLNENCKVNFLKALLYAILRYPFRAIKFSRKYYDMTLNSLVPKKVNHCIMNSIYLNMKMNFYDEALNSLSEGLRLSQTVSDEQSINLCLLNLFEIAYRNNYQKQATLLLEYAVNHAQQLSPQHRLQSALIYGSQVRYKQINYSLLKKKHINWKDIIHQSLKQILQSHSQDIEQSITAYQLVCANNYGNSTMIQNALDQLQQFDQNDQTLSLQLEALSQISLHQPLYTLSQFQQCFETTYNLSEQSILVILNICLEYFEIINEPISIKYIKQIMMQLLQMNPDPYISESLQIVPIKNPKLRVKQLLKDGENDLEIIRLCKQFHLNQQYLEYKLNIIERNIKQNQIQIAQDKLNNINLYELSQSNCVIQAKFWNLMARIYKSLQYYATSINFAIQVGWISMIQQNYYDMTFIYDQLDQYDQRDYCAEQFNKVDALISQCIQNTNLIFFKINEIGIVEYLYRFLNNIQQQFSCNM